MIICYFWTQAFRMSKPLPSRQYLKKRPCQQGWQPKITKDRNFNAPQKSISYFWTFKDKLSLQNQNWRREPATQYLTTKLALPIFSLQILTMKVIVIKCCWKIMYRGIYSRLNSLLSYGKCRIFIVKTNKQCFWPPTEFCVHYYHKSFWKREGF